MPLCYYLPYPLHTQNSGYQLQHSFLRCCPTLPILIVKQWKAPLPRRESRRTAGRGCGRGKHIQPKKASFVIWFIGCKLCHCHTMYPYRSSGLMVHALFSNSSSFSGTLSFWKCATACSFSLLFFSSGKSSLLDLRVMGLSAMPTPSNHQSAKGLSSWSNYATWTVSNHGDIVGPRAPVVIVIEFRAKHSCSSCGL